MRRYQVRDVLELKRRQVQVDTDGEYSEIGVRSFGRGIFHKEPTSGVELGNKRVFEIWPGDLVLSNVFAWEGAVALAGESEQGRIGSHRFMTFVTQPGRADASYLRYFFVSEAGLALLRQASPGSAGRNRTLAIDRFENLTIPLPDMDEQRRVATQLDRLFRRLDGLHALRNRREPLLRSIPPALAHRPDMTDSQKSSRGWSHLTLSEVLEPTSDETRVEPMGEYPMAGVYSFGRGLITRETITGAETKYKKLYRLSPGQLVMSRLKAWEGALGVAGPEFAGRYVSQEFPIFCLDESRVDPSFLGSFVKAASFWEELSGGSQGVGARRERVPAERLLATKAWLPPIEEQRQIAKLAGKLAIAQQGAELTEQRVAALRLSILNSAFAGAV